ncbi:class I SAM-dependent methyltransferase [Psychrosphaera haliotis]|uniref:DUF2431 domain-containing protein n=1 Tax=Psychrosphaera haliotis TaxID=555083 RepID=A0A6N8F697_9GAMM|nr:class I SAM-dependent methyltransferase [Psychrosphaera haliotis]MUH72085.1 DUF2431 domain-containing protein [Psychrosphaera haliotis]
MYLPKNCRVITVGDGDLSFSRALLAHVSPNNLIASTYDSESVLRNKYKHNALDDLLNAGVAVFHDIDITNLESVKQLPQEQADIVIFNHPLVPTQKTYAQYQKERNKTANLLNRNLLYHFIKHSFDVLLSSSGERLCYITTKSVKPYSHWHIETSLTPLVLTPLVLTPLVTASSDSKNSVEFLGSEAFNVSLFKNYLIRNVDRDKCVKHEASDIYVYSDNNEHNIKSRLTSFQYDQEGYCPLCRKGPFANQADWELHKNTRIHKAQWQYHLDWQQHKSDL